MMVDTTESKEFVIKLFNSILMVFFVKDINLYKLINTQLTNSPRGPRRENSPLDCFLHPPFSSNSLKRKKIETGLCPVSIFLAPQVGLEPTTS